MGVYPVGTPTVFEIPGQAPLITWHFPADFTTLITGSAGTTSARYATAPVAKPTATSMFVDGYDINFSNSTWNLFPILYCQEASGTPPTGPTHGQIRNTQSYSTLLNPPSVATAPDGYGAPVCHAGVPFAFTNAGMPYVCGVANWKAGDSGTLALVQTLSSPPQNGPFTVDCGSGPNRALIVYANYYGSGTDVGPVLNGVVPFSNTNITFQSADVGVQRYSPTVTYEWVWVNPPTGSASLTPNWGATSDRAAFRGVIAASAYAGVDQGNPIAYTASSTATSIPWTTTPSFTTPLGAAGNSYWISDLTVYSNPSVTLTSAGTEFGNMHAAGFMSASFVHDPYLVFDAPVTTSWSLSSAQAAGIRTTILRWDAVTPTPEPPPSVAIPSRLATIVG